MVKVVLLSDVLTSRKSGQSRYAAPYVLATQLEKQGFRSIVIDYFTKIPDFFAYLKTFLNEETLLIGISSSFLSPAPSGDNRDNFYSGELWMNTAEERLGGSSLAKITSVIPIKGLTTSH